MAINCPETAGLNSFTNGISHFGDKIGTMWDISLCPGVWFKDIEMESSLLGNILLDSRIYLSLEIACTNSTTTDGVSYRFRKRLQQQVMIGSAVVGLHLSTRQPMWEGELCPCASLARCEQVSTPCGWPRSQRVGGQGWGMREARWGWVRAMVGTVMDTVVRVESEWRIGRSEDRNG